MTISFNNVPSNLRIPFMSAEFNSSRASTGPALLSYRALLVGQKIGTGTGTANSFYKVTSADAVAVLAGRGSMLHRMAKAFFNSNKQTECWIGVVADNSSGVAATGTITVAGTATADGTISLYLGGDLVQVAVSTSDSASTIATNIAAEIGKHATGTVTLSSADAADNVTIGATTFVGTTGAVVAGAATYSVDTGNTAAAASLASQVNAHAVASTVVQASANSGVVTLRAVAGGTAGNAVVLTTTDAIDLAVSGTGTLSGATDDSDLCCHASASGAVVTLYFRHKGAVGNEFDVRVNWADGEATPAGITLTIVDMASGATNPTLTTLISALGDEWYQIIAHPYTDSTSLTAIENELSDRFGPDRMIDGVAFACKDDTYSALGTLGDTRNSQHSCIIASNMSPTAPFEIAAAVAAEAAKSGAADPARPFQTLPLTWVKAPAEADRFTNSERNLLLYDGISTTKVAAGGLVQIERLITTYQTNGVGAADTSYLDVTTMLTLMYLRYSFRNRIMTRYPRHKLADDGTKFGAGQAVITPDIGKAEAVAWFREMESLGLVENFEDFKTNVRCVRDTDVNRLNWLLPPNLINQFIVGAASIQFIL